MTKGRQYNPLLTNDGTWFHHRRDWRGVEGQGSYSTSTRSMLETSLSVPPDIGSPPTRYSQIEQSSYRTTNPFSSHDNRHTIQGQAEYLGNGCSTRHLGRRLHPIAQRLHHTDPTFFYKGSQNAVSDYSATTATTFTDPGHIEPLQHRRFPKIYRNTEAPDAMTAPLSTSSSPHKTPLQVLARSQQPFLSHNSWRYSYQGPYRIYPPYNRK